MGLGHLTWGASSARVSPDETIYDLASLTKVVGTTTAIMVLYDQGRIMLDAPVVSYLPAFTGGYKDSVTIRELLTHHSGLPPGRDLLARWRAPPKRRANTSWIRPSSASLETATSDSDLGADVLGMVVEAVSGERLDVFLDEHVFEPLGMRTPSSAPQTRSSHASRHGAESAAGLSVAGRGAGRKRVCTRRDRGARGPV